MPDAKLAVHLSRKVEDLKAVRLQGSTKSLDQLTVAELVAMRPGGATEQSDAYSVNAFTDNVSVSTTVRDAIVERWRGTEGFDRGTVDDLAAIVPGDDGRVCLGWGYATGIEGGIEAA